MKLAIAIISGTAVVAGLVIFVISRPRQSEPLVHIHPFKERAGRLPPVDANGLQRITAASPTLTLSDDSGNLVLVGSCEPSDSAAVEAMFLSTPVSVDEGIDRIPHNDDLAAMIALTAELISLLGSTDTDTDLRLDQATRTLGSESRPILEQLLRSQPTEFRISRVLAIPPSVGGPGLSVKREDLDDMPTGTRIESVPIEINLSLEYQTATGTDRSVSVGFMHDAQASAWVLRSVGTIMDRGTMYRLFDDIEAQNKLIASTNFSRDDPDGILAVRDGSPIVLR